MSAVLRFCLVAVVVSLVIPADVQAQTGTVTGIVTAADNGRPVPGATVRAMTAGGQQAGTALTNAEGRYRSR